MAREINKKSVLEKLRISTLQFERKLSVDQMLNGELIGGGKRIDDALKEALVCKGKDGKILTLPELIQARLLVDCDHNYWDSRIIAYSEQNIGIDYDKGEKVLFIVHGDGLINYEKLLSTYNDRISPISVVHSEEEFRMMLKGIDTVGNKFPVYTYEELSENEEVNSLYEKYGVIVRYELIKDLGQKTYLSKEEYLKDPLLISLIGSRNIAEQYYDTCKKNYTAKDLEQSAYPSFLFGSFHYDLFKEYSKDKKRRPQGSVLVVGYNYLYSDILDSVICKEMCKFAVVKPGMYLQK